MKATGQQRQRQNRKEGRQRRTAPGLEQHKHTTADTAKYHANNGKVTIPRT
jgi:hypothetical protein